ncbi:MAG: helix-turn-helix transcriptional regulator [Acidimicrobiia bacterium]
MTERAAPRLEVFKALGDNTRYAIYLELARSSRPLSTAEIAGTLGLHGNTVRPHLERMREVGLLEVEIDGRGGVGRPQHRYHLAADAPSLGLEPPVYPLATRLLLRMAAAAGLGAEDAIGVGRDQGRLDATAELGGTRPAGMADETGADEGSACVAALGQRLAELGFDPTAVPFGEGVTVAFGHCPFRELAEANPDLVCGLHQGLVEGLVATLADAEGSAATCRFRSLVDRNPCQVDVLIGGMS